MIVTVYQCKPKNHPLPIFSWLIRLFSNTNYSHYAIRFNDIVLDATSSNVRFQLNSQFKNKYTVLNEYHLDVECDFKRLVAWSMMHLNKGYGFLQIVGILMILLKLRKTNPFGKDSDRLICNELVLIFLRDFKNVNIGDSDSYGLNETDKFLKENSI